MRTLATPIIVVLALTVAAAAALVAYLAMSQESAGSEEGVTVRDILEEPARHEGERVAISGEWYDNEHFSPDQAEEVIVLGDDADQPLLVIPRLGVEVPQLDEDTAVAVEGVVRIPERAGAGFLAPDALMEREHGGVAPVLAAESVELVTGAGEPLAVEAEQVTVPQLLRDPRAWDERELALTGTATRVVERGFTLMQDGATIFVSAPSRDLSAVEAGDGVHIRAELSRLSAFGSDALEDALQTDPPGDQPSSASGIGEVPIDRGEPYLLLRGLDMQA